MKQLEKTFKALSDPNRMRIVNLLLYGESCVCRLQEILRKSQPKISRHLAYLKSSEVVKDRRMGTRIYYNLKPKIKKSQKELLKSLRKTFLASSLLKGDLLRLKQSLREDGDYFIREHPLPALPEKKIKENRNRKRKR
jgi:ArsR family transcriptional regulator